MEGEVKGVKRGSENGIRDGIGINGGSGEEKG